MRSIARGSQTASSLFGSLMPFTAAYIGPGDLATFTGWWGLRAFTRTTKGARLVQLRRASDSALSDFGSLATGALDYTAIQAFQGASSLTVAKFYDQSGNGYDMAPTAQALERPFTLNVINGRGVYDNTGAVNTAYRTTQTFSVDLNSHSVYSVCTSGSQKQYQNIFGTIANEFGTAANTEFNTSDTFEIKNEGHLVGATHILFTTPNLVWHASGGVVDQTASPVSFFNVDNVLTDFADLSGNIAAGDNAMCMLGDDGNGANTNPLIGYAAEIGWYTTAGTPWSTNVVAALIANAKAFWGF